MRKYFKNWSFVRNNRGKSMWIDIDPCTIEYFDIFSGKVSIYRYCEVSQIKWIDEIDYDLIKEKQ